MTLNAVVHQTLAEWEVVIDDGSSDDTRAITESWKCRDWRFRTIHQEKLDVSAARNRGPREAKFPYVLFLEVTIAWRLSTWNTWPAD